MVLSMPAPHAPGARRDVRERSALLRNLRAPRPGPSRIRARRLARKRRATSKVTSGETLAAGLSLRLGCPGFGRLHADRFLAGRGRFAPLRGKRKRVLEGSGVPPPRRLRIADQHLWKDDVFTHRPAGHWLEQSGSRNGE